MEGTEIGGEVRLWLLVLGWSAGVLFVASWLTAGDIVTVFGRGGVDMFAIVIASMLRSSIGAEVVGLDEEVAETSGR